MWKKEWQARMKQLFGAEGKKQLPMVWLLLCLGVLLMLLSGSDPPKEEEEQAVVAQTLEQTVPQIAEEERVAELLSQVRGAGVVDVMIRYASDGRMILAENESLEELQEAEQMIYKAERTLVTVENAQGDTTPVVLSTYAPEVLGVVIVAQGAGDAVVAQALSEATQALFDLEAHEITVLQMK